MRALRCAFTRRPSPGTTNTPFFFVSLIAVSARCSRKAAAVLLLSSSFSARCRVSWVLVIPEAMNSSFRNLLNGLYRANTNALGCGKVAFYADFMRFPQRYPAENGHKTRTCKREVHENRHFCTEMMPKNWAQHLSFSHLLEKSRVGAGLARRSLDTLNTISNCPESISRRNHLWPMPLSQAPNSRSNYAREAQKWACSSTRTVRPSPNNSRTAATTGCSSIRSTAP